LAQFETGRAPTADERKLVTIVFADVSGFTALSEKLDPEKVRELINACFDWLVPVVQKYDGHHRQVSSATRSWPPVAHEDDAERALRAALDMMDAIVAFNHANGTELGLVGARLFVANGMDRAADRALFRLVFRQPARHPYVYGRRGLLCWITRGKRRSKNRRLEQPSETLAGRNRPAGLDSAV
jgi:hypothetical protein